MSRQDVFTWHNQKNFRIGGRMVLENIEVYGLKKSIKASKYPMSTDISKLNSDITPRVKSLGRAKTGSGHSQFLHGIIVQFDLTFSNKAWVEAERYHWLEFVSSQSTMHKITKFDLDKAYIKYVDERIINIMKEKVEEYNKLLSSPLCGDLDATIKRNEKLKEKYLEILYSNPCGFQLAARMSTNYERLKTMYWQRKNHRLPEWREFCEWIEALPHFKELCLTNNN